MLVYHPAGEPDDPVDPDDAIWLDLVSPSDDELTLVERKVGLRLPSRVEMRAVEPSRRLREERGSLMITQSVLHGVGRDGVGRDDPDVAQATLVLTGDRIVTLRFVDPEPFRQVSRKLEADPSWAPDALSILVRIEEAMIDRLSDVYEQARSVIDEVNARVFDRKEAADTRTPERRYEEFLFQIGAAQRLISNLREVSVSTGRAVRFLSQLDMIIDHPTAAHRLGAVLDDASALQGRADHLSAAIDFLLDATLGMINLQQNLVMKILSVVSVVLMPPTLLAGIYGMNFERMAGLHWALGFPAMLVVMLITAVVPYRWARSQGWL
ncbi:MAG: CorA family divalent cation transporter [Acidimicrobiales bacterium]